MLELGLHHLRSVLFRWQSYGPVCWQTTVDELLFLIEAELLRYICVLSETDI